MNVAPARASRYRGFMPAAVDTLALIGNTPLVRLNGPSNAAGCDIFGKCEFANPGASVKDRAALWIVRDAEARGALLPGGTIVEGTAGNTGIGLALVANALGYKTIKDATGADVEVVVSASKLRGDFLSIAGAPAACDSARALVELTGAVFTDSDDDDLDFRVDFYRV